MMRAVIVVVALIAFSLQFKPVRCLAETTQEYENQLRLMIDYAVRLDDYIRSHLGDKKLAAYAQAMSEKSVDAAERMTPPDSYKVIHPHVLLVLENTERSFFFAAKGDMSKYRYYQKTLRKELQELEALSEREHLELYIWGRQF
jgi:hypothetical protein